MPLLPGPGRLLVTRWRSAMEGGDEPPGVKGVTGSCSSLGNRIEQREP